MEIQQFLGSSFSFFYARLLMYIYVYSACSSARVDEETPPAVSLLASKMQPTNGGGGGAAAIIVGPRI